MDESRDPEISLHFLDYWRIVRSRKEIIFAVTLLVLFTGLAVTVTLPRIFEAVCRIKLRQDALDVSVFQRQMIQGYNPYFLRTEYEVIQSKTILYQVIKNLDLRREWARTVDKESIDLTREQALRKLSQMLRVDQYRDTSLVAISVKGEDAKQIARIANEIADVYREHRLLSKKMEIRGAVDVLKDQLEKQQERVNRAEDSVEQIRGDYDVSMLSQGVQVDKVKIQQLESDRIAARVDMLARKARLDHLRSLDGEELMKAAAYIVDDHTLTAIRQQLMDSEVTLKLLLENFGVNHPDVKRVQAGVNELKVQLNDALTGLKRGLESAYATSRARYEALDEELEQAKQSDITSERERFLPFHKAERELAVQRAILEALQARVAQEGIELEAQRTPVEIVDRAEAPTRPVSPNLLVNIILSLVLGLGAGVGLAFFIEYLDTSVKTVDDVEKHLGLPVIGVIPQKVRYLIQEGPDSAHAESYRVLRTNLQFSAKERGGGTYSVTSGGVGEGKSTTLANLAYVCSTMGDKVLIVDSDLRRPIQHQVIGVSNRVGLVDVLTQNTPLEEAIQPTSAPNLHFLPSGKLTRSIVGILDSQRMKDLVNDLRARYDYVFFDSPPLMGVSDASVIASEVDGVLLVVQYRKYPRVISSRAKRILESVGANVMGVVLNNINIMRDDYYYYYHTYYSHYYHPEEEPKKSPSKKKTAAAGRDKLG